MYITPYTKKGNIFDLVETLFPEASKAFPINQSKGMFKVDVKENQDNYQVLVDLPGVKKENVDVKLRNGLLTLSIKDSEEISDEKKDDSGKLIWRERKMFSSSSSRTLNFGEHISGDVSAKMENGVLELVLTKSKPDEKEQVISIQ